jgi:DNA-binding response OmpR family regulator
MSLTCLLIDDEPNLLLTLTHILRSAGYQVIPAQNALDGLAVLQEQSIDVMIVDLKMPQIDGISLILQTRATHASLPIIIMTAHASLETAIEAVRQGARDYLIKPVDPAHLLERIRTILSEEVPASKRRELLGKMQILMQELRTVEAPHVAHHQTIPLLQKISSEHIRTRGGLMMNLKDHQVVWNGKILHLSPTNFDYLLTLLNACPNPVPLERLVQLAQGYQVTRHEAQEIVRWRIRELRELIEPDPANPRHILTVRSVGYRLNVDH